MKHKSQHHRIFFPVLIALMLIPLSGIFAASVNSYPYALKTTSGAVNNPGLGVLAKLDQSGTADTPARYVLFKTPGTSYRGYLSFKVGPTVTRASVSGLRITINYKGPAKSTQAWNWLLYDWNTSAWVKIGDNSLARANIWKTLTFTATSPLRFINTTTKEIRLQLTSGNASGDAKIDYAAILVTYNPTPTAIPSPTPSSSNCALFPTDNIWNTPIDTLPIHAQSSAWVNSIGRYTGFHMDFGSGTWDGGPIGIPFNIVSSAGTGYQTVSFYYPEESDPGPYPIPANPLREYGSDHHILLLDTDTCTLYEIYDASYANGQWSAGSGAIWNLNSNALRPAGWTSADAAGLPMLPGLVRYDEIAAGEIKHALRFTASQTAGYTWPARHLTAPASSGIPPMGARFRLKASYNISSFPAELQVILTAMKKYGIILADNGAPWYVSGAPDERWNNDMLHQLDVLTGDDFEAVDISGLVVNPDSGQALP